MKRMMIAGLAMGLMVGSAGAQFGPGGPGDEFGPRRDRGFERGGPDGFEGPGHGQRMRDRMEDGARDRRHERALELFDADGDGRLNDAEREQARAFGRRLMEARKAAFLKRFDADGDGELSKEEREVARETIREEMEAKRAEFVARFDTDGDGALSKEEREAAHETVRGEREAKMAEVTAKYDANGNGRLDVSELENALDDGAFPMERPMMMRRGGPGGPEGVRGDRGRFRGRGGPDGERRRPGPPDERFPELEN